MTVKTNLSLNLICFAPYLEQTISPQRGQFFHLMFYIAMKPPAKAFIEDRLEQLRIQSTFTCYWMRGEVAEALRISIISEIEIYPTTGKPIWRW